MVKMNPTAVNFLSTSFISKERAIADCPAIGATGPDAYRSDRYTFVSSERIVDSMEENNWGLTRVEGPKFRKGGETHGKHAMYFRSRDADTMFEDPRQKVINYGEYHMDNAMVIPELCVWNSMDGTTRLAITGGLFALVCANGLIICTNEFAGFSHKHLDFDADSAYQLVVQFSQHMPEVVGSIDRFQGIELDDPARVAYGEAARDIRFGKGYDMDSNQLLNRRRDADNGNDLWTVFNAVQENCMRGGLVGRKRKTRELTNASRRQEVNQALWDLTKETADTLVPVSAN